MVSTLSRHTAAGAGETCLQCQSNMVKSRQPQHWSVMLLLSVPLLTLSTLWCDCFWCCS